MRPYVLCRTRVKNAPNLAVAFSASATDAALMAFMVVSCFMKSSGFNFEYAFAK